MQEVMCLICNEPIRANQIGTSYTSADVHRKLVKVSSWSECPDVFFLSLLPLPPEIKENTTELVLLSLQCAFYLVFGGCQHLIIYYYLRSIVTFLGHNLSAAAWPHPSSLWEGCGLWDKYTGCLTVCCNRISCYSVNASKVYSLMFFTAPLVVQDVLDFFLLLSRWLLLLCGNDIQYIMSCDNIL